MTAAKQLILGTAMWGWTIAEEYCYALLDAFYAAGGRQIDCATNYPINKNAADFRRAEKWLLNWIGNHQINDLKVMMKVGSLDNLGGPHNRLSKSFLLFTLEDYIQRFGTNLHTFMLHWDNRDDAKAIRDSLDALVVAQNRDLTVGLSGIRHPNLYATLNREYGLSFRVQIKHNLLRSDLDHYTSLKDQATFIAYGINAGGVKLDPQQYRPDASLRARGQHNPLQYLETELHKLVTDLAQKEDRPRVSRMNHLGMIYAFYHPQIQAVISGPSRVEQLEDSLRWMTYLQTYAYQDYYQALLELATPES